MSTSLMVGGSAPREGADSMDAVGVGFAESMDISVFDGGSYIVISALCCLAAF